MFEKGKTIFKIDGRNLFVDVQEAFAIGKVCFMFRRYDDTKEKGNRITGSIDCYMTIEEFSYFCHLLKTARMGKMIANEIAAAGGGYPKPAYILYGGTNKPGSPVISRKLQVEKGMKTPYVLTALQGPGKAGAKGQIMPAYMDKDAEKITVPMAEETACKLGLTGERAIQIHDTWTAMGTLQQNLERLKNMTKTSHNSGYAEKNVIDLPPRAQNSAEYVPAEMRY